MKYIFSVLALICVVMLIYISFTRINLNGHIKRGTPIDSLDNVVVYFNGGIGQSSGRTTADGYNIGIKYQCVEFVKRYYYQHYHHRMPDAYGNAKSFFDPSVQNGKLNLKRGLIQYSNGQGEKPQRGDLVVFGGWILNRFGHVAIISDVTPSDVEVIQQNAGTWGKSRERYKLTQSPTGWCIDHPRLLGWLRKP